MSKPLLLLKTGSSSPDLAAVRGDYDRIFVEAMDWLAEPPVVHDAVAAPPPDGAWGAVVITGSPASVHAREPWSEAAARWLPAVVASGTPVLGVCYGHQLIAHALGGRTERSPRGPEVGRSDVSLDVDDPLFDGLPRTLPVLQLHWDHVVEPPAGARVLASSARCPVQAMAIGDTVRSVQFHPEFDEQIVGMRMDHHGPRLDAWRAGEQALARETLGPAPASRAVLRNFVVHFTDVAVRA